MAQLRILYFQCIPDERRGDSWIDVGGHENEREIMGVKVMRRDKHGQEVPYMVLPFPNRSAVAGVILGPNNSLSDHEVRRELANLGFSGASVRRSTSPYRSVKPNALHVLRKNKC